MMIKGFCTSVLFLFFSIHVYSQSFDSDVYAELENNIENHIRENKDQKFYQSIEFSEVISFNYNQLVDSLKAPKIFHNVPWALSQNEKAIQRLSQLNEEANIVYSMNLIFGLKERRIDAWNSNWAIILLDDNLSIIESLIYYP